MAVNFNSTLEVNSSLIALIQQFKKNGARRLRNPERSAEEYVTDLASRELIQTASFLKGYLHLFLSVSPPVFLNAVKVFYPKFMFKKTGRNIPLRHKESFNQTSRIYGGDLTYRYLSPPHSSLRIHAMNGLFGRRCSPFVGKQILMCFWRGKASIISFVMSSMISFTLGGPLP